MSKINSLDIETYLKDNFFIPFCISINFRDKLYSFYKENIKSNIILECITFIFLNIKEGSKEIFYIHNLKFDATLIIFNLSNNNEIEIKGLIEKGIFYSITLTKNNKIIELRCSYKLLPISLNRISLGFSLGVKKMDFPYKFVEEDKLLWNDFIDLSYWKQEEWYNFYNKMKDLKNYTIIYCENDCLITKKFVEKIFFIFYNQLNINILDKNILTMASLSFYTFYNKFNTKKVKKYIKKDEEIYIRDSYFGGRCEVFGNPFNENSVYYFDFKGMYGQCMMEKNVLGYSEFIYDIDKDSELKPGFYNIDWESNMHIPVLPHHNQINNKLLFCNGSGNGTYWFEEINLFKEMGGVVKRINSGLVYSDFDYIFKDFVEYFDKYREINYEYKTLAKSIINSFYGRTGLSIREDYCFFVSKLEKLNYLIELSEKKEIEISYIDEINEIWLVSVKVNEKSKKILEKDFEYLKKEKILNIAIASSIASKARIKLYRSFLSVIEKGGRILYCDTDSVFAEFDYNVLGQKMGEIYWDPKNIETSIIDCVFISPKTYAIKNEKEIIKIKGINNNSIKFKELKESFYKGESIICNNNYQMKYNSNFKIEFVSMSKKIDLALYDKRKFLNGLKKTESFYFSKGKYF